MKSSTLTIGLLAILPVLAFGQEPMEHPPRGEFFDTVLESVGEAEAAELQAQRDELNALREEVRALRGADEVDEEALAAAIDNLRAEGSAFREEVRGVIEENEDLQAALEEARANGEFDRGRRGHRGPRDMQP